ncbi:MAG: two-component regulator propeller domain-containing protein, partial [Cyclobacteriaceae bacterium]
MVLIYGSVGHGQGLPLPFRTITVEDGLPQNSVTALVQDDQGYLWIGTQDGLAKYDGYEFSVYRHEKNNPNSLSHNFVWNITKDSMGILWITTLGNGLTRLDPRTGKFTQFLYRKEIGVGLSHWNTFSTFRKDSILYVGTNESLDKINLYTDSIMTYYPGLEFGKDSLTSLIRAIAPEHGSEKIWLSTNLGLTRFDPIYESFEYFSHSPFGQNINLRNILSIRAKRDELIICTATHLLSLNFKDKIETVLVRAEDLDTEEVTRFTGFLMGAGDCDYIFSRNGIFERNSKSGSIVHHQYDPHDRESLTHDYVISMLQTNDGALWA